MTFNTHSTMVLWFSAKQLRQTIAVPLTKNCRTFALLCDDLRLARLIACFDSIPALIEIFRNFTPGTSPDRFFDMSCVDSKANPSGELCVRGSVDTFYSPAPLPLFGGGWGRSGRVGVGVGLEVWGAEKQWWDNVPWDPCTIAQCRLHVGDT